MRNYLKRLCLVLLALLLFSVSGSWAQSIVTGGIAGTITDATGAVVGEAKLTLKNIATTETLSNTTSAGGEYLFPLLKPGDYTLTVTKDGFKTATRPVTVVLGTTVNASLALEVGSASTTVEVSVEQAQ